MTIKEAVALLSKVPVNGTGSIVLSQAEKEELVETLKRARRDIRVYSAEAGLLELELEELERRSGV